MPERKYKFTGKTLEFQGRILKEIEYLRYLSKTVDKGIIGGWIEGEHNLSHGGDCSVQDDSKVFGNARIIGNSEILDEAIVKDNATILGNNTISKNAVIGADTIVDGACIITDNSQVYFYEVVTNGSNGSISTNWKEKAHVYGDTAIQGNSLIEATGEINCSYIEDTYLHGYLFLKDEWF